MTDIAKLADLLRRQADIAEATGKTYWAKTMLEAADALESLAADAGMHKIAPCKWIEDENEGAWDTYCGNRFILNEGAPSDNDMKFCCYCGGVLSEARYEEEET